MNWNIIQARSLKTKVTVFTLAVFVTSLWSLAFYTSRMLREDMQRQLAAQQQSTVAFIAKALNEHLQDRLKALERIAAKIPPAIIDDRKAIQNFLDNQPVLLDLFSGGVLLAGQDGTAIAEIPRTMGRVGFNFMDREVIRAALTEGGSNIGNPVMGKQPVVPAFGIAVPIRNAQGQPIAALAGVVALQNADFLDHLTQSSYGQSGGYALVALKERLIITATRKDRTMQRLSAPGIIPAIDRFVEGHEAAQIYIDASGLEVMSSAKHLKAVDWAVSATIPTEEAFAPIHEMQRRMLLTTILLTLLAGILTWWMLRRLLSPMLTTAQTLAHLASTDQPPQALPMVSQDEIGDLIMGFNRLLETLSQREIALKASEQQLFTILENVDAFIYLKDSEGRYLFANRRVRELLDRTMEEIVGQHNAKFFDEKSAAQLDVNDHQVLKEGLTLKVEESNLNQRTGHTATYLSVKLPLRNETGEIYALCGISTDITERKLAEETLARSEARYRMIFDSTSDAVLMLNEQGFFGCNKAGLAMFGCPTQEDFCAYHPADLSPAKQPCGTDSMTLASRHIANALAAGHDRFEWVHQRADTGETFSAEILLNAMNFDEQIVLQATCRDITERKRLEEQIRLLAFYDTLTSLPNRRLINDRLHQAVAACKRNALFGALIFLDLDNFKPLNDTQGHDVGDLLLIEVANRLKSCVREMDTVGRFGGDEFVIMLNTLATEKAESLAQAGTIAEKIRTTLSAPYQLTIQREGKADTTVEHHCTASIGVALFNSQDADQDKILKRADNAMYQAKETGRNTVQFASEPMPPAANTGNSTPADLA